MKIAIIHANLARVGGAENLIIWYTSTLVERGYDITLITGKYDKSLWDD
ncbi:hypothetical protein GF325_17775, partial [Candidatus Bathyarchaeota archaeon]|nr:hypothetical protein [Candidatus Bathyarchaeota archaeon]